MSREFADSYMRFVLGHWRKRSCEPKKKRYYYDAPWYRRWRPGQGKFCKRKLHKATRQARKAVLAGRRVRGSYSSWNSVCDWKGH